jgi:glucosamine--fructose-6-phosphate aminotransferase (isomerizing)
VTLNQPVPEKTRMFAEAAEAAHAVARQLEANAALMRDVAERLRAKPPRAVITYARGSSDHAATFARYVIETRARVLTSSAAPSIASIYSASPNVSGMLALAISQSGKSPDVVAALVAAKAAGADTLALVNDLSSPLAGACDVPIPLHAGAEHSVAATKSFICALSAVLHLIAEWRADNELTDALKRAPDLMREAWDCDWAPLVDCLEGATGLYVISRGPGFGIAQEAALKFKETCALHAEAFSAAEVRHGPLALVGPNFSLLVFRPSDESTAGIDELVRDVIQRGGRVFLAGGQADGAVALPSPSAHPLIQPMLQILAFYRAANALSLRRGLDPDRPPHLMKVTETL